MPRHGYFYNEYGSGARAVEGGIKLQSGRGKEQKWWARRWLNVLESFDIGGRLQRGRTYARKGQVASLDIEAGKVTARVQGSQPKPYDVTIGVKQLTPEQWERLAQALSMQAIFAAKLLAGEMPQDVENVFASLDLSLFPEKGSDLKTNCSCPDASNPCKHIAAVYYLLGDEFDRDPFLIFKLRGITREELLSKMGPVAGEPYAEPVEPELEPEPLTPSIEAFWNGGSTIPTAFDTRTPAINAALPKQLGAFPFWRGERPFLEVMAEVYARASKEGIAIVHGDKDVLKP
jgi:uncharacterized Zn finger protein